LGRWPLTAALGAYQGHGLSYPAQVARPLCSWCDRPAHSGLNTAAAMLIDSTWAAQVQHSHAGTALSRHHHCRT